MHAAAPGDDRSYSFWLKAYLVLLGFSMLGTLLTFATGMQPGFIRPLASFLLLLTGFLAVCGPVAEEMGAANAARPIALAVGIGAAAEIIGVYTGFPFGSYTYSAAWWPAIPLPGSHWFPLLVPFAWMMVAGASYLTARRFFVGPMSVVVGALIAALVDLAMEPVMVEKLGYWSWTPSGPLPGGAPILNFVGWFAVSLVAGSILHRSLRDNQVSAREPGIVLAGHLIFVGWLALFVR